MEDRRTRASKRLAGYREEFRDLRSPIDRDPKTTSVARPAASCTIKGVEANYYPGDLLMCSYSLDHSEDIKLTAVETSVIWYTSGKGAEDIGVHFFERRQRKELEEINRNVTQKLTVRLPNTPLSYDGKVVQLNWCVRIRVFLSDGRQLNFDEPFRLGNVELIIDES